MSLISSHNSLKSEVIQQLFTIGNQVQPLCKWKGKCKQKGYCSMNSNHLFRVKEGKLSGTKINPLVYPHKSCDAPVDWRK